MAGRERGKSLSQLARRLVPGALLVAGTLLALAATQKLAGLGRLPDVRWPFYLAYAGAVVLALLAGVAARSALADGPPGDPAQTVILACRPFVSVMLSVAALFFIFRTWQLDSLVVPPPSIYLWWLAGIAAAVFSFPRVRRRRASLPFLPLALVLGAVLAGAAARLPNLGRSPAVYGGDEANQVMDGRSFIEGTFRASPFGAGWYSTMRPGMLLAGAGAMAGPDPVAGARLPYAVIGTLSVAAVAGAGWLVAGPWGGAAAAALLAFAPHHVHFSRLSSVMILDALFAPLLLLLLLELRRSASPRVAALAGATAGFALYGYTGGRAITLVFLLAAPIVAFRSPAARRGRWFLLPALFLPFLAVAGPNIRFAVQQFASWNGRLGQVSVFSDWWWDSAVKHWGSAGEVVRNQFALGTVGLLSEPDFTTWFAGHPIIGPSLLVAAGLAGLGWLFGRRKLLSATLLLLLAGANVAGVVLTNGAPTPQRASSLVPMLAILGGAAVAGFLSLLPESTGPMRWRSLAGGVFVAAYLLETGTRRPFSPDSSPDYAGAHTAFAQVASEMLRMPGWRSEPAYVYGLPHLSTDLPTFHYLLGNRRPTDVDPAGARWESLPPGLHFFAPEFEALGRRVRDEHSRRGFALPHPADPLRNVGYVVAVPAAPPGEAGPLLPES